MEDIHSALEVFETTVSQLGLHVSWQISDSTPFSIRAEWSKARHCGHSGLTQWTFAVYAI